MVYHRKAKDRGHLHFGWLETYHTFSFGSYFDPRHMGFSVLRVINDDTIEGGYGFDTHPHRDMEIVTFVMEGAIEHKDTLGSHGVVRPGEIQVMSAGTGIRHSEYNHLKDAKSSLYQIWIEPNEKGIEPRYEQRDFTSRVKKNSLVELVAPKGDEEVASIHADARIALADFEQGRKIEVELKGSRSYWLQMVEGKIEVDGRKLEEGDGLGLKELTALSGTALEASRFLFFDLP